MNAYVKEGVGTAREITIKGTPCSAKTNGLEDSDQREKWFRSFGKMSAWLVDRNRVALVDNGDFDQIREYMIQYQVFSQKEVEIIEERNIRHWKMSKCLDYLVRKTSKVIEKFFVALKEADECLYAQLDWSFPADEEIKAYYEGIQDNMEDDVQSISINVHVELKLPILQVVADNISQMSERSRDENETISNNKANDKRENEELQAEMHMSMFTFGDDWTLMEGILHIPGLQEAFRKNWQFIRPYTYCSLENNDYEHNIPFITFLNLEKHLKYIFDKESCYLKINVAVGYLLEDPETKGFKYIHSSRDSCVLSDQMFYNDEISLERLLFLLREAKLFGENKLITNLMFYVKRVRNYNSKRLNEYKMPGRYVTMRVGNACARAFVPFGNFNNGYQKTCKSIKEKRYKVLRHENKSHGGFTYNKATFKETNYSRKENAGLGGIDIDQLSRKFVALSLKCEDVSIHEERYE